ncbi:MAG: RNA polymerase sigma factor [Parcubacteria group bacterium]|nr:RNA polymerase sigma factor [Parcubacteria group bacterium]
MKPMFDNERFIQAYEAYADAIFRYFYFRVFDRDKAQDLSQETFTKTWEYLVKGNEVQNIRAFLYQVARNLMIDRSRKKVALSLDALHEKGFDPGADVRDTLENTLDADRMLVLLKHLEEKYREVILMRFVEGLSPREIARALDETENVIYVRVHRGLRQLRALLDQQEHKKKDRTET